MRARALLLSVLLSLAPFGVAAQEPSVSGEVQSPILTIDVDRLLAGTQFGRRIAEDLRDRTEALAAENERLRVELTEEERSLTERRPSMEMDEFRAEADAFDRRVQGIRADQDAKQRALEGAVEEGRQDFLNAVTPVLGRLMIDTGAAVILERRDVFLSASLVDITDRAIAAIDAQLGDGRAPPRAPVADRDGGDAPVRGDEVAPAPPPAEDMPAVPSDGPPPDPFPPGGGPDDRG